MTKFKSAMVVFLSVLVLAFVAGCGDSGSDSNKKAAAPAKQPNVVTAQADSPEGKIQKAIADAVKASSVTTDAVTLDHIDINLMDETHYNVNVWANYSEAPTASLAVKAMKLEAVPVFAGAYKSGQPVGRVAFIVNGPLVNKNTGKESTAKIFQLELRSDKAGGFDWSKPDSIDPDALGKPWIHQAYRN